MCGLVAISITLGWILLGASSPLLLPGAARTDCLQWDISGSWKISQSNGFLVSMDLQQNGTTISGTGSYGSGTIVGGGTISGTIDNNNNIELSTSWGGVYRGGVGSDNFIGGATHPVNDTGNVATWRSTRPVTTCLTAATPPSSAEPAPAPLPPAAPPGVLGPILLPPKASPPSEPAEKMSPATVELDVDIYNKPGGEDAGGVVIGALAKNTQGVIANCDADNWCHVLQWMGNAPVHRGWVYSGPDYKSLKF